MNNYDVVAIGNSLMDIQVLVSDDVLAKLQLPKGGMVLYEQAEQQEILQSLNNLSQKVSSGGSAANTIHGLGALSAKSYYFGKISNDDYGDLYYQDMQKAKVGFHKPQKNDLPTGTSVILITPDAQRTMATHLGASSQLSVEDIKAEVIEKSKYVYIEGYLFTQEPTRSAAIKAAQIAKSNNIPIAFTLSDVFVVSSFYDDIKNFVEQYTNILFCNETEALALSKEEDPQKAFEFCLQICDSVFLTRSADGAWAYNKKEGQAVVKAFPVDAVDTTGAGDLFAAGALYGLLQQKSIEQCAILGSYCASQVITHLGARLPAHSELEAEQIFALYSQI